MVNKKKMQQEQYNLPTIVELEEDFVAYLTFHFWNPHDPSSFVIHSPEFRLKE